MSDMKELEVFYDFLCPWCYLGTLNTDRLHREYGLIIRYTLFPLHPEIPDGGIEIEELFIGRPLEAMKGKLKDEATKAGLPIAPRSRLSNSRRAQELEKWAESLGKGDEFRIAVYRAYFCDGHDIALIPVLKLIAESAGLDKGEVRKVLEKQLFAKEVEADWSRARKLAIMSVPFYLYGEEPLVGYRPYKDFLKLIGKG
ncbi:MAG TPA: DsbA family protein [Geobacteraceae bacterium]|nr:DsbA family protein [Geobacteraceae bacterium]